jgi:predicted Zn-dependent peptidase
MEFSESTLANGLRVASTRNPYVESAALSIWVGVGGRHEPRRLSGVSHFIEHLLFKGTRRRSARDISEAIEGKGGYFNAFTQEENTCYYTRIAAEHLWEAFDVLVDMYLNPLFTAEEIDRERGVILEEIMMYRDQPHHMVQEMLGEMMWTGHALGRPLIGSEPIIAGMTRAELLGFKQRTYVPDNTLIAVAGNIDHQECVRQAARMLGRRRRRGRPPARKVTQRTRQERVGLMHKEIEQAHLALGFRVFGRHDRRRYALKLLSVILGENMSSRLFQVVRERHGLAYSIHSSVQLFDETGVLAIQAGLERERVDKAVRLILKELTRVRDRSVSGAELKRAKDYAVGQLRIGLESTTSQMMWVGENLMGYDRFTQPETIVERLAEVEAEDIRRVAAACLQRARSSVAMIAADGDPRLKPDLETRIAGF